MDPTDVYPIRAVEQNAVFYGTDGFTLLGTHGPGWRDFQNHFLAVGRQELHAEGVARAVGFTRAYLVDAAADAIVEHLRIDGVHAAICDKDFPDDVKREAAHNGKGAAARNREEYAWLMRRPGHGEAMRQQLQRMGMAGQMAALDAHREEIAHGLAAQVFPGVDAQATARLEKALSRYLDEVQLHGGLSISGNKDLLPAVEAEVKVLLLKQLDAIAKEPEVFADAARAFLERPVALAKHVSYAHMPEPRAMRGGEAERGKGARKLLTPWARHEAPPAPPITGYERPFIDGAKQGPAMAPIIGRINDVLMGDFTPQMRALILDQGLQVMVTGEKALPDGKPWAMYADQSHSYNARRALHLWHAPHFPMVKGGALHTEDKQVLQEELIHYATSHPVIDLGGALQARWEKAFVHDLGGLVETQHVQAEQRSARELIREHYTNRAQYSWNRRSMDQFKPILAEVSAEMFVLEKSGVRKDILREALPELYPLQETLMNQLQHEGQKIMDARPDIARWAQEPIVAHVEGNGHAAQAAARNKAGEVAR